MGPRLWREFIYPVLKRMYGVVREAGKFVMIHSCGDVDELFDDLIGIGLNCFNPFQPEVMDVDALMRQYRGPAGLPRRACPPRRTLPYGTRGGCPPRDPAPAGNSARDGGYIFAPAHAVEGDVPLENMLAFIETAREQIQA